LRITNAAKTFNITHINVLPLEYPDPEGGLVQNFLNGPPSMTYRIDCKKPEVSISSQS
jgi:hypothetical protein